MQNSMTNEDGNRVRIVWITRTAVLTALLVVLQAATAPLGNTLITGSIVNLILIISVMLSGYSSGLAIALISPALAKLFGIGPLWTLIPFVAAGNLVLVSVWHFVGNRPAANRYIVRIVTLVTAAIAKFATLYLGIVKIAVPVLLSLPDQQAKIISNMFSIPQLITATIGGTIATLVLPTLSKAIAKER